MSLPLLRLPFALRLAVLAVVLLGVLVKPIYSTWCETHQLGHAVARISHVKFRPDSPIEHQLDVEHARGGHGLLHATDDGGVYVGIETHAAVPAVIFYSVLNPPTVVLPAPVQRISRLFRPPIA